MRKGVIYGEYLSYQGMLCKARKQGVMRRGAKNAFYWSGGAQPLEAEPVPALHFFFL